MSCFGITGAMRTAPTSAMEVFLELPPLHLQVEVEAKIGEAQQINDGCSARAG
jgi:hypothetical protein